MTLPAYVPPEKWYRWPNGTKTCWWCAALVAEEVADVHDAWHKRLEGGHPIAGWDDESGLP